MSTPFPSTAAQARPSATDSLSTPRGAQGTAIGVVFFGLAVGYPIAWVTTAPVFLLPLIAEFGWGKVVPSMMAASSSLGIILMSLWFGKLVERFGAARIAAVSGVCLSGVFLALSFLGGSIAVAVSLAFLAGILGIGTSVGLYLAVLPRWFDKALGRALGVASLGISVGVVILPPYISSVERALGWRTAYWVLAAIHLVVTLIVAYVLSRLARAAAASAAPARAQGPSDGTALGSVIKLPGFPLLCIIFFCVTVATLGAVLHLLGIVSHLGVAPANFPRVMMAMGVGTMLGRIGSGVLLDFISSRVVGFLAFASGAIALLILGALDQISSPWQMYVLPAMIGLAIGAEADVLAYMVRRLYGTAHYAVIYNRLLISFYLGAITGPMLMGLAADKLGSQSIGLFTLAAGCVIGAILVWFVPIPDEKARPSGVS
jgi:MFS transporter, OFA family, oxalate/formate antiporter